MPTVANPPNVVNITIAVNSARTANGRARRLLKSSLVRSLREWAKPPAAATRGSGHEEPSASFLFRLSTWISALEGKDLSRRHYRSFCAAVTQFGRVRD